MKRMVLFTTVAAMVAVVGPAYAANENSSCNSQINAFVKEQAGTPGQNRLGLPANEFAQLRNELRDSERLEARVCGGEPPKEEAKLPN